MPGLLRIVVICTALCLAACQTIAPNRLSAADTADLRFTSLDVRVGPTAVVNWGEGEDAYLKARGLSLTDPALVRTPEAHAFVNDLASHRLKAALERSLADRPQGSRPVRLIATITKVNIDSVPMRVIVGGASVVGADIDVVDARTGAVLTPYRGAEARQFIGNGLGGVIIDAALVSAGMDDVFDRAANAYAANFRGWLRAGG